MNFWRLAATGCFAWAVVITTLWIRDQRNAAARSFSPILADEPGLIALERTAFARQFQDRLLSYDQASFTPGQTALTFLMAEPLRRQQLDELAKRSERRGREFQQASRLRRLRGSGDDKLVAEGRLLGRENSSSWNLDYSLELGLEAAPRSIENPWGWQVRALEIQTRQHQSETPPKEISLHLAQAQPAVLGFPCFVQNVHAPKDLPVKIKLTSMNVSEVQLHRSGDLEGVAKIEARCADRIFKISLRAANEGEPFDLHTQLEPEDGVSVADERRQKRRKNDAYQKTLEDELGFVVED